MFLYRFRGDPAPLDHDNTMTIPWQYIFCSLIQYRTQIGAGAQIVWDDKNIFQPKKFSTPIFDHSDFQFSSKISYSNFDIAGF